MNSMTSYNNYFEDVLSDLSDKDLLRRIKTIEKIEGNQAYYRGRAITLFCSNDYLGLSKNERVIQAFKNAAQEYGVGSGAARLIAGSTEAHTNLEKKLAALKRKPACLLFSAGYLANVGVLSALAGKKDLIVMDKLCHASLIDGARLSGADVRVFPHKSYEKCRKIIQNAEGYEKKIIVTDAVFSMDGDLADLEALAALKNEYQCLLIVDDAHGTGVMGPQGCGACVSPVVLSAVDVITGTLSKAVGCFGGFAVCSETLQSYLINRARSFIFATSLPPAVCAAALESIALIESEPKRMETLKQRSEQMSCGLREFGFDVPKTSTPIIPIIIGSEKDALLLSQSLFEQGFWVPAIRYPTVAKNQARLRVTVNAAHSEKDIESFLSAISLIKRGAITDSM